MKNILFIFCLFISYSCTNELETDLKDNTKREALIMTRSTANLTINHPNYLVTGKPYNFYITGIGVENFSYLWSFGDNATLNSKTGSSVSVTFHKAGIHPLSLTLYDLFDIDSDGFYTKYQYTDEAYCVYQDIPSIIGDGLVNTKDVYEYSMQYSNISSTFSGEWEIPHGIECVYTDNKKVRLKFHNPGIYTIKCRAKEYAPQAENSQHTSEWSTKTIEVSNYFPNDTWFTKNTEISQGTLSYDITYKATKDYYLYSLYIVHLYNGAYDGTFGGRTLDWEYRNGYYFPPIIDSQDGSMQVFSNALDGGSTILIKAGTTRTYRLSQTILPGKQVQDFEYTLFYLYDNTKPDRYREDNDFI